MKSWHILSVVALVGILGFLTVPTWNNVRILQAQKTQLQSSLDEKVEELKKLDALVKTLDKEDSSVLSQIPIEKEQENLIRNIQKITVQNKFSLESLSFSLGQNNVVGLPEIKIAFSTQGKKSSLKSFLKSIEKNQRFLGLENLSINTGVEDQKLVVNFGVSLYSFFQK